MLAPGPRTPSATAPVAVAVLGSTGSIGTQALALAAALPERIRIVALAAGTQVELLAQQIRQFTPELAVVASPEALRQLQGLGPFAGTRLECGPAGLAEVAQLPAATMVLSAIMGAAGLAPTLAALQAGKDVALANKETLVAGGELVLEAARRSGATLWPVDSEHSALAQCLLGEDHAAIARLTITASGGPFAATDRATIAAAPAAAALKHPTWTMGQKISIDSATLMNKGLEMIEAYWLFGIPLDRIDIVVHRQSIVHSFVSFVDGSVKAQLGQPDMRAPIQWALLRGERCPGPAPMLNLAQLGSLTFEPPDSARFPAPDLARAAMRIGGTAPAALNAANEVAVAAYLAGATSFYGITDTVAQVLERHHPTKRPDVAAIVDADASARRDAGRILACGTAQTRAA